MLAGCIVPIAVCSIIVICRFYSRRLIKSWGWDDTTIAIAWFFSVVTVTLVGLETRYGLGHQRKNIPVRFQNIAINISYGTLICYQIALIMTKISILLFYLRFLKFRFERILIFCTIGFVCVYGAVLVPFSAVICNPLTGQRALSIGTCYKYYPIMTASAILHSATDVWLIILVLPHILKMSLPRPQKIGLAFVLTLGLFDACASLTRMSIAYRFLNPKLAQWDSLSFAVWTTLETSLGVMCASIPMLRPMARQLMGRKPSKNPEVVGNVPRSGRNRVQMSEGSMWSTMQVDDRELEMPDNNLFKVSVSNGLKSEGRSGSIATRTTGGSSFSDV